VEAKDKIREFFEQYPLKPFAKRELLLRAEEPIGQIFYLVQGRVSQYDIATNGNEVVVNVFKPGAFFPMSSAINSTDNHYFFEASLRTVVRVAPQEDVVRFLRDNPAVTFDLLARVYRGVGSVLRRMAHLMGGDAKSRLILNCSMLHIVLVNSGQMVRLSLILAKLTWRAIRVWRAKQSAEPCKNSRRPVCCK